MKIVDLLRNKFNSDPCVTTARGYIAALEADLDAEKTNANALHDNLKWLRSISFDDGELSGIPWPEGETRDNIEKAIADHEKRRAQA